MAVSFPFVMLAMDYFPLRRHEQLGWGRLVREKALMIVFAGVLAAVTMITESRPGGLMVRGGAIPLLQRVLLMFQSLAFYPWRLLWPMHLSAFYPLGLGLVLNRWWVPVIGAVIVTALAVWGRSRLPALAAAWGAYLVLVLPVSGLMQRGLQAVALRYAYMATLPLLLLVGGAVVWVWRRSRTVMRAVLISLLACVLCVFGARTRTLIPYWHDDETLWRSVLVQFPDSEIANRLLLHTLLDQRRASEALEYAQRCVKIDPEQDDAHFDLGSVLDRLGRLQEAVAEYEQAVRINPGFAEAYVNMGSAFLQMGRPQEAIGQYEAALRINPDYPEAHNNLGAIFQRQGKLLEAVAEYEQAVRINPGFAEAYVIWAAHSFKWEDRRRPSDNTRAALRSTPIIPAAHSDLGAIYQRQGKLLEAVAQYEQAVRSKPDYVEAHFNLGLALEKLGRPPEAVGHSRQALKLRPDYIPARNALTRLQGSQ